MITFVSGDLFTSPAKALVNTVNTVGVMGKGIAKTFKEIYPAMFAEYQRLCEERRFGIGMLWLYRTPHKWILNFPTKQQWRQPSRPEFIEAGLKKFIASYAAQGITSIAFPRLGCGNGELDWESVVRPLMLKYLDRVPIDVFVYHFESRATAPPEHRDVQAMAEWLRSEPRALPFTEMWADLSGQLLAPRLLKRWGDGESFRVSVVNRGGARLRIEVRTDTPWWQRATATIAKLVTLGFLRIVGPGDLTIEEDALVDLWQSIRAYGLCMPRTMPAGLDALSSYVMPVLALLGYMKPVEVSTSDPKYPRRELALQLIPPAGSSLPLTSSGIDLFLPSVLPA